MQQSFERGDGEAAQQTEARLTELQQIIGLLDGTVLEPRLPSEAIIQQHAAHLRKSLKPLPQIPELPPDPPETEEPPPGEVPLRGP